jgi:CRISPR-associated endonuclease/helicase Cas3
VEVSTEKYLAHSARNGCEPQEFSLHTSAVLNLAVQYANEGLKYAACELQPLLEEIKAAALLHDAGKLTDENQAILQGRVKAAHLIKHEDAGSLWARTLEYKYAQQWVYSHHMGLQSRAAERAKQLDDPAGLPYRFTEMLGRSEQNLPIIQQRCLEMGMSIPSIAACGFLPAISGFAHRFSLSCLIDADHTDTAIWQGAPPKTHIPARWKERLHKLEQYVATLPVTDQSSIRQALFQACKSAAVQGRVNLDAVVGSGKTLASMVYALRTAIEKGLRHIFVVAPYCSIIIQTVDVLRKVLVLDGEDPESVVAEIHHKVEPSGHKYHQYAMLWEAPVIVTTAVSFFETLAGHTTKSLRKLHQLPGSAVIIDESHASTPYHLYAQNERWMKELAESWGCSFLYASGSLIQCFDASSIIPQELATRMRQVESHRVQFAEIRRFDRLQQSVDFIESLSGPRLVIMNTVHNAAVVASALQARNSKKVMHLSTALTPADQAKTLAKVRERLKSHDKDWTLVATSCVECGVDISFFTAVRETCSVASLLQVSGRVNRHGEYPDGATLHSIVVTGGDFMFHHGFGTSRLVLLQMWDEGWIKKYQHGEISASELVTEAYKRECALDEVQAASQRLMEAENKEAWADLNYYVIDSAAQTVITDRKLADQMEQGTYVPFSVLMRYSVHIWEHSLDKAVAAGWAEEIGNSGLYRWTGAYDDFLGYMAQLVPVMRRATQWTEK